VVAARSQFAWRVVRRIGIKAHQIEGHRAQAIRRNDIAWERITLRISRSLRLRIDNQDGFWLYGQKAAEIASLHRGRGHRCKLRDSLRQMEAFVAVKEKCLVLDDRSAQCAAVLIALE